MALFTGSVTESLIKNGKRFIKFIGMGRDDVKQHRAIAPWGDESAPIEGAVAIYGNTSVNGESVVIGYINQIATEGLNPGEKRFFSTDSDGVEQIYIKLTNQGKIEFGAADDNLMRFNNTKDCIDEIKDDINTLKSLVSSWTPVASDGGAALKALLTIWQNSDLTENIDLSKIDELQCSDN